MSGFFRRLFTRHQEDPSTVQVGQDVVEQPQELVHSTTATVLHQVMLDLTHQQRGEYSIIDIQHFEQFLATCPPLRVGQFDFQAYEVGPYHGGWYAHVFVRNAVSVDQHLGIQVLPLSLYDARGKKLANHVFQLKMEPIKFGEARLHTFYWPGETSLIPLAQADLSKVRVDMV